jgi:hypothetical protein
LSGTAEMKNMLLNCEYITKLANLPFFLEFAVCDRVFVDIPVTSFSSKPLVVVVDHVDAFLTLTSPPEIRDDKGYLRFFFYSYYRYIVI